MSVLLVMAVTIYGCVAAFFMWVVGIITWDVNYRIRFRRDYQLRVRTERAWGLILLQLVWPAAFVPFLGQAVFRFFFQRVCPCCDCDKGLEVKDADFDEEAK